ncbi:mycofactocin-coupled SDR family oxidoreductase [Microbacterium sp.]|jgi:SDR family mycofactocin-dependent oxidoreductase|uniref:mycofactocin-coupled SDR family oxidoreductase n=1 Tax=Microbacterium sp. TaxID=51671 RepID=UPI002BB0136D|nr:mycofactocin-coupled SDR family oxidoreductase [Microbacterium sp.]HWL76808.1 mycofactocin-coupled SDR family oxidoreductase [Microbacterium sp.]
MAGRVEGKVAFITGAARGQGRSHAVRLAQEGADIIAVDLCDTIPNVAYPSATPEDLAETVRQVEALDRRIVSAQVDVRDGAAVKKAVEEGVAQLGKLDIVVANAGICVMTTWDETSEEVWDQTIDTNLKGVWNTVRHTAPHLVEAGGGSIIMTSSAAGLKGLPFLTAYVASKHGVVGLMRAFATELSEHGIRVNSIHPTGVDTPMGQLGDPEKATKIQEIMAAHPRLMPMMSNLLPIQMTEPIDISNAVLFLASDESRYVTSLAMTVDAGNTQY